MKYFSVHAAWQKTTTVHANVCFWHTNVCVIFYKMSTGGVSGTVADPKVIFIAALKANASNIILTHNHPSGSVKPSRADIELTKKIKEGGYLLEVGVLDHLIISIESYYSFPDEGLM